MKEFFNQLSQTLFGVKFTKATATKALRTFLQAALAYIAVNIAVVDFANDEAVVKSALIGLATSAIASGIAAVMNLEKKSTEIDESEGVE